MSGTHECDTSSQVVASGPIYALIPGKYFQDILSVVCMNLLLLMLPTSVFDLIVFEFSNMASKETVLLSSDKLHR